MLGFKEKIKWLFSSKKIYFTLRLVLGGLFVYAGILKISDPKAFAKVISQYNLVPESLLIIVAFGLPVIEIIAGAGLIFDIKGSLTAISAMIVMFIIVLWYGILNNLEIDCGCFSLEEQKTHDSLREAFYRDWIMLGGAMYLYCYRFITRGFRLKKVI
ncbi:MAG: DoxX family membrane protein [Thermodesulfovibrionales bacterium]|nr:DoxX family membrane protein [Thermodesulfovibrionales bacterium]